MVCISFDELEKNAVSMHKKDQHLHLPECPIRTDLRTTVERTAVPEHTAGYSYNVERILDDGHLCIRNLGKPSPIPPCWLSDFKKEDTANTD